jgi:hypothetical protein
MLHRYQQWTREHQAELELDAANQRLVAQARRAARGRPTRSNVISRLTGLLRIAWTERLRRAVRVQSA